MPVTDGNLGGGIAVSAVTVVLRIVHLDRIRLDAHLKGLEVDLAGRLLVQEGRNAVLAFTVAAVVLLIVDGVVLDERHTYHGKRRPHTREKRCDRRQTGLPSNTRCCGRRMQCDAY